MTSIQWHERLYFPVLSWQAFLAATSSFFRDPKTLLPTMQLNMAVPLHMFGLVRSARGGASMMKKLNWWRFDWRAGSPQCHPLHGWRLRSDHQEKGLQSFRLFVYHVSPRQVTSSNTRLSPRIHGLAPAGTLQSPHSWHERRTWKGGQPTELSASLNSLDFREPGWTCARRTLGKA